MDVPLIDKDTTIFWFRRDLRIEDNAGLYHALKSHANVLPLFIFDTQILDKLEDKADRRVTFIHHALANLKHKLEELGSSLLVLHGDPVELFMRLQPRFVFTNHDYEPYARDRDTKVLRVLAEKGVLVTFKDHVIFERDEVLKDEGKPYTMFTPYSKKWKSLLNPLSTKAFPVGKYVHNLKRIDPLIFPSLPMLGFKSSADVFPEATIDTDIIARYHEQRDFPAMKGTTRLSVQLRFGTISIRKLVRIALRTNEAWLNELIWREFYQMILWHFPLVDKAFKPAYDRIVWRNNPDEFKAWCEGRTGYPIVDAGMRELNETGFMHNRVRMIAASFLVKHLLIDWRWGESYFSSKLLDFDLAANNGGWQWASGSGCDAAPYFRIFNPLLQLEKFDPQYTYVRKWVPEFNTPDYPKMIVDHDSARHRAIRTYKEALSL